MRQFSSASAMFVVFIACLLASSSDVWLVSAYSQQHRGPPEARIKAAPAITESTGRRGFLTETITVATMGTMLSSVILAPEAAGAVIQGKYCAYGEGNDCEDLAEGNPYILELQKKSAANKEANIESAKNAFYAKNYPDWFAAVGKTMIQKESDGTFIVIDNAELQQLWAENKVTVKVPTTLGGKITDVTQKPMLVLKE